MRIRCLLGYHCWHTTGRNRDDYYLNSMIPGVRTTHLEDYRARVQECCECDATREIL